MHMMTAPRFHMALTALTQHVRSEVIACVPIDDMDEIKTVRDVLRRDDPANLLGAIAHMATSYHFQPTYYLVAMGEDPHDLRKVGYIIYLRPAPGDRAKLPPQVYYLSVK